MKSVRQIFCFDVASVHANSCSVLFINYKIRPPTEDLFYKYYSEAAAERMVQMAVYNNSNNLTPNRDIEYRMVEHLGVIDAHKNGWNREVSIVAWNGKQPKIDIRDWDPEHERMSRGITLYEREAIKLARILSQKLDMSHPDIAGANQVNEKPEKYDCPEQTLSAGNKD